MDFNFILLFIDVIHLQLPDFLGGERQALGSDDPIVKGLVLSMFAVSGFGIMLNLFNSAVRKKMVGSSETKTNHERNQRLAKRKNGCNEI